MGRAFFFQIAERGFCAIFIIGPAHALRLVQIILQHIVFTYNKTVLAPLDNAHIRFIIALSLTGNALIPSISG
jgi:hypothetical protein